MMLCWSVINLAQMQVKLLSSVNFYTSVQCGKSNKAKQFVFIYLFIFSVNSLRLLWLFASCAMRASYSYHISLVRKLHYYLNLLTAAAS